MQPYSQAIITLLAVINPVVCGVLLMEIGGNSTLKHRFVNALKIMLMVLVVLVLATLLGKSVLHAFGISIDTFKIVGGVIIAFIGFGMFTGKSGADNDADKPATTLSTVVVFAASPGTIATVIALSATHNTSGIPTALLVSVVCAVILTWLIMLLVVVGESRVNPNIQKIFTCFMGLILTTMGLQFILTGLKSFMGS